MEMLESIRGNAAKVHLGLRHLGGNGTIAELMRVTGLSRPTIHTVLRASPGQVRGAHGEIIYGISEEESYLFPPRPGLARLSSNACRVRLALESLWMRRTAPLGLVPGHPCLVSSLTGIRPKDVVRYLDELIIFGWLWEIMPTGLTEYRRGQDTWTVKRRRLNLFAFPSTADEMFRNVEGWIEDVIESGVKEYGQAFKCLLSSYPIPEAVAIAETEELWVSQLLKGLAAFFYTWRWHPPLGWRPPHWRGVEIDDALLLWRHAYLGLCHEMIEAAFDLIDGSPFRMSENGEMYETPPHLFAIKLTRRLAEGWTLSELFERAAEAETTNLLWAWGREREEERILETTLAEDQAEVLRDTVQQQEVVEHAIVHA